MYKIDLNKPINVYFIGIGGISMSGLAKILAKNGFKVSGTDRSPSEQTEDLINHNITVNFGHRSENITKDIDLVVYTAAISNDNPELIRATELGIPTLNRADLLGEIMENYKESICVCGTHGKTTTTSMVSLILMEYTDPTVTIGGVLPAIKSNVHIGDSPYFVAEACEYTNSFFSFFPKYNVILNVEEDHPDFFKDLDDIRNSFKTFAGNTKEDGVIFINSEIPNYGEIANVPGRKVVTFGLDSNSDVSAKDIVIAHGKSRFMLVSHGKELGEIHLLVPGIYNVVNALGAISLSLELGIDFPTIKRGLSAFTGAHRRFEHKGNFNGATIIDDYAHHPTEVKSTLLAAREYEPKRLIVIFQPHTYSRTEALFSDFVDALSEADLILLSEIYPAREENIHNTSSKSIADALISKGKEAIYFPTDKDAISYLEKNLIDHDLLITMGAGNIYFVADSLVKD